MSIIRKTEYGHQSSFQEWKRQDGGQQHCHCTLPGCCRSAAKQPTTSCPPGHSGPGATCPNSAVPAPFEESRRSQSPPFSLLRPIPTFLLPLRSQPLSSTQSTPTQTFSRFHSSHNNINALVQPPSTPIPVQHRH
jgi:hypothetical protein